VLRWHRSALPGLERSGLLRLVSLKLDGETIGVVYSLVDPDWRAGRVQYVYLPGYSPLHAALRPGTVLLALEIERAAREGIVTFDLLRGDEAYEKLWGAVPAATWAISMRAGVLSGTSGQPVFCCIRRSGGE